MPEASRLAFADKVIGVGGVELEHVVMVRYDLTDAAFCGELGGFGGVEIERF